MPQLLFALCMLSAIVTPTRHSSNNPAIELASRTPWPLAAQANAQAERGAEHDFDFEIGTWTIHMRRLVHPLSGQHEWIEPQGYSHIVIPVWGGSASLAQLENDRPTPHFDGLMLRMYDPRSHKWNVYWGSSKTGTLDPPLVGEFRDGRGEFFVRDTYEGNPILVRLIYSDMTPQSFRTETSYSADNGKTWETNLEQTFTRVNAR